ncbi:MAG TPA: hypothetical protein VLW85_03660 [Myxococcales bacterium]|nr:hypothetical protein [Myxococcales bacterium]
MNRPARLLLLALLASCAHAPPPPPVEARAWPPPPARPRVEFAGSFPGGDAPARTAPMWKRLLDFVVGLDPAKDDAPLLQRPFGIAAAAGGFLVADPDRRAVLRVHLPEGTIEPVECAALPWKMPLAVAGGPDGSLYVADGGAGRVVRIGPDGACAAIGAGRLERPSGAAFAEGRIYVADPPRHEVVAFSPDGAEALHFGAGQLHFPTSIAAAPDQSLMVVDALHFRIVRFRPDGSVAGTFGEAGDGGGAFGRPKCVAVDGAGRTYVSDAQNDVVIVFSKEHAFELALGGSQPAPGSLTLPAGVAVGGDVLYVADTWNHRVQMFRLLPEAP